MSIHITTTTTPTLPTSCISHTKKRKRSERKQVRFDTEHITVIDTYSAHEYDRGSLFSLPVQYKLNPNIIKPLDPLDLCSNSDDSSEDGASPQPYIEKKRPKLSIDTGICAGPLFLTQLSTHHVRHKVHDDNDYDSTNDYLIPVTPTSAFPSFLY
ncbi:hypothetical protein BY458DRAFT_502299 [Sporodiniella umbellata]|nr:hypothetical protein BY458DRAFT_502299 [Sporodiniella umbellata]